MTTTGTDTNPDAIQTPVVATGTPTPDNPDNAVDRIPPAGAAQPPTPIVTPHVFVPPDASISDTPATLLPASDASRIADLQPRDPNTVYVTAPQDNSTLSQVNDPAAVAIIDGLDTKASYDRLAAIQDNNYMAQRATTDNAMNSDMYGTSGLQKTVTTYGTQLNILPKDLVDSLKGSGIDAALGVGSIQTFQVDGDTNFMDGQSRAIQDPLGGDSSKAIGGNLTWRG